MRKVFFKECAKEEEKRLYQVGGFGNNLLMSQYGVNGGLNGHHMFGAQEIAR